MTPTSLIIVTDRGSLKAYKVSETPTRGPHLQLVQAFDTTEAHGRYQDKLTDQAGAFPNGAAPGQGNSIAERTGIDNEDGPRPLAAGQFFLDALEDQHVRVDAHADRQDEAGHAGERHDRAGHRQNASRISRLSTIDRIALVPLSL